MMVSSHNLTVREQLDGTPITFSTMHPEIRQWRNDQGQVEVLCTRRILPGDSPAEIDPAARAMQVAKDLRVDPQSLRAAIAPIIAQRKAHAENRTQQ